MSNKCWVLVNDNGGTSAGPSPNAYSNFGPLGFNNTEPRYTDATLTKTIDNIKKVNLFTWDDINACNNINPGDCNVTISYSEMSGTPLSRLWTYDVTDNNVYWADTLVHLSPDIGMGNSTFIIGSRVGTADRNQVDGLFNNGGNAGQYVSGEGDYCSNCMEQIGYNCAHQTLTLNQYSYSYSAGSEPSSFSKKPYRTYRLVDDAGQLIGVANSTSAGIVDVPVGKSLLGTNYLAGDTGVYRSIGYVSDNEVLVDDQMGNIYYVRLDNYYMGSTVYSSADPTNPYGATPHNNTPGTYTDLSNILPHHGTVDSVISNGFGLEQGWAICSRETDYKIYTVIAQKIIDLNYPRLQGASMNGISNQNRTIRTQGDLTFIASDPSQGGQPTVAVSVINDYTDSPHLWDDRMPAGKSLVKYVVDLDNFTIATVPVAQQLPVGAQALGSNITPGPINSTLDPGILGAAIVKEPGSTLYYLLAGTANPYSTYEMPKRYSCAITNPEFDFFGTERTPINVDTTFGTDVQYYFWTQSMGQLQDKFWLDGSVNHQSPTMECTGGSMLMFNGGSQPPDCVYPSSYTYNCTINGCQSVYSSTTVPAGQFSTIESCTASCVSYSCNSVTFGCLELPGTGQTGTFTDEDDCDELCMPPYWLCGENGCITGTSTNFTYTSLTQCQESPCETWNCTANGCLPQIGSGGTYETKALCTASCFSYEISCVGDTPTCEPFNIPYYGTGGTFTGVTQAAALTACTAATASTPCISWVCNEQSVAQNTDIYVYYDTTSMSFTNTTTAHDAIMQWTTTIPGWTGKIYHTPINNERWLGWAGIPFQQPTSYGLRTQAGINIYSPNGVSGGWNANLGGSSFPRWLKVIAWGQSQPNGAYWFDNMDPSAFPTGFNVSTAGNGINTGLYSFRGFPPYAGGSFTSPDYSVPVLNVIFADESDGWPSGPQWAYNELGNTGIYYDVNRVASDTPSFTAVAANQIEPTAPFQNDYNRWVSIWNDVQTNNGSVATFVYPTKPVNYSSWGSGTKMVFKHMALSVLATISSGNMDQYINPGTGQPYALNGLWSAGTAPRMSSAGGASGSVPGLCSIANLTELETTNPYWDAGYGGLDQMGFGTNVEFPTYTFTQFQTDLNSFVQGGTVTVATGCTSAATSTSTSFPYSSQTDCLNVCSPMYECTSTGCILNATGGTYETYSACTASCQSWSCTTLGCDSYNSPLGGTGGTYVDLIDCQTGCTSWQCSYVPQNLMYTQNGCVEYIGTGQTFSAESACTASCVSWDCGPQQPCTSYPNTAHTFSSEAACTADTTCSWFQCQVAGCVQQAGNFTAGPNNYLTEQLCKDVCVGWGCSQNNISSDTNIYAFYDTSSLTLSCVQNAHNSLVAWINSIPGYTGNTYHTAIDDERWLDWGSSVYSGSVKNGLQTPNIVNNLQNLQVIQWASTTAQASDWYDNMVPGTQSLFGIGNVTTKGLPPTTSVTGKTLIINFIDEADGVAYIDNGAGRYHGGAGVVSNIPPFSGGSNISHYQPTSGWTEDYTAWTSTYAAVTVSGGSTQGFVYPIECSNIFNQGQQDSKKTFALQVVASITAGDQSWFMDGTFSATTYPRTAASGGLQGGIPPLCGIADLQMLSVTNPYFSAGTGNLGAKGWGYNVDFLPFNSAQFQDDLGSFLTQTSTSSLFAGQCVSAETLWNQSITHPYSCETCTNLILDCCSCNCAPPQQLYACTDTGCTLSVVGTMTWDECNNPANEGSCVSYSCSTNSGCHDYNFPNPQMLAHNNLTSAPTGALYPNPLGGTGGTFTQITDCYRLCTSWNCETYNQSYGTLSTWNGCIAQIGTGGTYYNTLSQTLGTDASYSACTADCKSYECNNPCGTMAFPTPIVTPAPAPLNPVPGCSEYPNTGATHLTEIACTASCEEHWYCFTGDGMTFDANCLNASSTGIISSDTDGQIAAISNNATWQTTQFGNLRWDMTGNYFNPSPTIAATQPLPNNPCVATAGHWARIKSVSHSILGSGTQYYTWATFIDALNTVPSVSPPLTYNSNWPDVLSNAGPHAFVDWEWCECSTQECLIGCIDELPLPAQTHGSYTSSTAATEVCCTGATATTWSCQTATQADTCDGLTLLPITYPTTALAYDYMAINNPTDTFSNYQYESTAPPVGTNGCEGPNGGQLWKLTGITLNNSAIQGNNYTSWASFITALQTYPAPDGPVLGLIAGMSSAAIEAQIQSYSAFCSSYIEYGKTECICTNTPCNCIELLDGSGTYTSQTECQLICCNSGTSWNCQNGLPYTPICGDRDYLGMYNDSFNALDHWRVNSANTQFGLSKLVIATPTLPGINPLTWAQVQSNIGMSVNWTDCYWNAPGTQDYWPYQYIANISHPNVNGGQTYNTWQTFSGAATTAGVTFNPSDSVQTVCNKIDQQIGGTGLGCIIQTYDCCSSDPCYCYELFSGGGTYQTQQACQPICCPPPPMGWECTPPVFPQTIGTCLYVPYGTEPTWNDCIQNCTGETSWNCVPGVTQVIGIDSTNCGAGKTEMNPGVPMSQIDAFEFALMNHPTVDFDDLYFLQNSAFGVGANACIDPLTGFFFRILKAPTWFAPGGIYDPMQAGPPASNNWVDVINYLNDAYITSGNGSVPPNPFHLGMTLLDIADMMVTTDPNWSITWDTPTISWAGIGSIVGNCECIVTPCDCVEVAGNTGQYPTYASCIPPCCQVPDETFDCTINGCVDPGGGYGHFTGPTALQDCEDVCWEWACNQVSSTNCMSTIPLEFYGNLQYNYGAGGYLNILPRTNVNIANTGVPPANVWQWAQKQQPGNVIIDFFGNPEDQYAPYDVYLNSVTGRYNMQEQSLDNYKMDTTTLGPASLLTGNVINTYCTSPNGRWWKPTGIGVVHRTTGAVIVSPHTTYASLVGQILTDYPEVCVQLGGGTANPSPSLQNLTGCLENMLNTQPYELNFAIGQATVGFTQLNGEFRLYGEGCVC